ncbi:zinc finger, CCHC-type containing protein [Tanacetum coccineum]
MAGNTVKEMTMNFGKLDKFEGHDFRRWQKKMHFLLTTLKVVYVLTTPMPELMKDDTVKAIRRRAKWENDDYICRGHILNGMFDSLFDVYQNVESANELWDSLESKYMVEDSSSKKFLESDKGKGKEVVGPYVNMTEEGGKNKHHKQKKVKNGPMRTTVVLVPTRNQSWNVGSTARLVTLKGIAVVVKRTTQMLVVRERGLRTNPKTKVDAIAWWIDSGATTHVCKDRCWFKTYEQVEDVSVLYMGDDHFAPVHGKGSVALEFSSGKTITLFNVLYVPKLRKNLVFGPMLNKCGYKQVYESDKYILSKSGVFVGFGYYNNGMFMLNLNKVPDDADSVYMSSSTIVNSLLWHARLGHDSDPKRKTLGEKGIACIFAGYAEHSKAYRFYVIEPNDSVSINSIIESRDAIFDENRFSSISRPKDIIPNSDESQRDDHSDDVPSEIPEPRKEEDLRTYDEAMQSWDVAFWKEAIDDEIGSIMENNTWVLSDLPTGCKPLGFRQKEGIDYFDTYAPVARITTIRLLFALAVIHNLVIYQMNVKKTFLNGDLDEEVYMKQPKGFVMPGVIICLYVDDMLLFGTDQNQVDETKKFLSSRFSMKDMGEPDVILGIKIKRENKGIVIIQSHYIEKILKKFNREDCSLVSTLIDSVEKLKPNTGKPVDQLEYSRAIGSLVYAMTSTRPDIAYAVGRLSRFTSNPSRQHWPAITKVFKYLKGTMNYGLSYVGYPSVLEGYSDASWINHVEDSSFTKGWVFLLRGGAISWASKKQTCITGSTMESEFVALVVVGKEAEWLRNLIHEISIWPKPITLISIHCDSAATLAKAYSQMYNGKSRQLGIRHSMIMELIMNDVISIEFVRSQHNLADNLTKGLARDLVNKSVIGMGLKSI